MGVFESPTCRLRKFFAAIDRDASGQDSNCCECQWQREQSLARWLMCIFKVVPNMLSSCEMSADWTGHRWWWLKYVWDMNGIVWRAWVLSRNEWWRGAIVTWTSLISSKVPLIVCFSQVDLVISNLFRSTNFWHIQNNIHFSFGHQFECIFV